jgi:leucyl/phenylalanyl-tRNA--protein transferase
MVPWLHSAEDPLPPTSQALGSDSEAPGLLAAGEDLSTTRLEEAYRHGVFPWFSPGQPVLWWSTDPRMVLLTDEFKLSRSLRKTIAHFLQTPGCEVRMDSAFEQVIQACSQTPREGQNGTWIVPEMVEIYTQWHREGRTHSVETWVDGELVGGLYGVCIGRMFFGESMFSRHTDASKIALAALVAFCRAHQVLMIDCQQATGHLRSLGGRELPRAEFEARLTPRLGEPEIPEWFYDARHWKTLHPALVVPSITV